MPAKLSKDELLDKAKERVLDAYESFRNRSGLEDKWRLWDALDNQTYEGIGKRGRDTEAHFFPAEVMRARRTIVDFITDVVFPPTYDWYRIDGVDGDVDVKRAKVYKKIGDLQDEKISLRSKAIDSFHRWTKYGFVIVKFPYVYKDQYVIAEEKENKKLKDMIKDFLKGAVAKWKGEEVPKKTLKATFDNNDFQPKSPWNMFWNYFVPWEEQTIIIEKIDNVTASHLKTQRKKGVYNDKVEKVIEDLREKRATGKVADETDYMQKFPHAEDITGLSDGFDDGLPRGVLLKAEAYFDIDQDGYDELCEITVALTGEQDGKSQGVCIGLKLRDCPLLGFSYRFCPWHKLEDSSLGVGVTQIGHRAQLGLNDTTNATMDVINEILDCVRAVDNDMLAEGQNLNSFPRKVIKVKGNPSEILQFLRPPNIINESMAAQTMFKNMVQNDTGANASLQGLAARYDTTASEYNKQGSSASRGIMCLIKQFEDFIFKPYKMFQYERNLIYLEKDTLIEILGKTAAKAALFDEEAKKEMSVRDAIEGDYYFVVLGVSQTENKVIRGQQMMNALQTAQKLPPGIANIPLLFNKLWDCIGDGDDAVVLPQNTDPSLDPMDENVLMTQGAELDVNPNDNDDEHTMKHMPVQLIPEFMPHKISHLKKHAMQKQKKMMAAQVKAGAGPQNPAFAPKPPQLQPAGPPLPPAGAA